MTSEKKIGDELDSDYRRKLGLDFNAKFSFIIGVSYPRPVWYDELSTLQKKLWKAYRRFGYLMTGLLLISNLVKICQAYQDIRVFTTCIGTIAYIICVAVNLTIFHRQVKIIDGVLNSIHHISRNLDNNPVADKEFFEIHGSFLRHVKIFGIGKEIAIAGGVGTLAFFEIIFGYFQPDKKNLPMSGWFPFDSLANPGFTVACLFQFVSYLSFLLKDVAIDLLFLTFLVSFNSYLIYLKKLLGQILTEKETEVVEYSDRKMQNLIWWIKQYQTVLRTIEDFKIISNPYLFTKYISVATILFFGGVLVTSDVVYDLVQQIIVLSINMSNLLQLYIFSVMGDEITENALKVADEGFDIALLQEERQIKILYFYTLCRSKKTVKIQFGNINPLSVHSFGQIVKMCFSYFTTIVQIRSDANEA